ncbi:hypothetical protein N7493_006945 [Penicillium malachiteum]|uniref:Uncharacterized protein n=1 Tax=Penicillium malachiteum TaxID=1324776 RepID=A0AAD6HJL8_9EURO|nr:hypothetical protein N7493_006945 [Penicillium malachiteum]
MLPPAAQWPALSGGRSSAPADTTRRVMNNNNDTKNLLRHIQDHSGLRVSPRLVEYLRNVEESTIDLMRNPLGMKWSEQLLSTKRYLAQQAPIRPSVASYAAVACGAPAPAYYLSSYGSVSSAPATLPAVKGDRELTVWLNDTAAVAAYRRETAASMTLKIDKLRAKVAQQMTIALLASTKVIAARQLVSRDIRITIRSTSEAELLRTHHN